MIRPPRPSLPLAALALAALAVGVPAQTFVYTLRENGATAVNGTLLEKAPGNYVPGDGFTGSSDPLERYQDLAVIGSDRWQLRRGGRIQKNGVKLADLPFNGTIQGLWWRMHVSEAGIAYAIRLDGTVAAGGAVTGQFPTETNPQFLFTDLTSRPVGSNEQVYALRVDGSVFRTDDLTTPGFQLDPEQGAAPQDNLIEGLPGYTEWLHLVYEPNTDQLYAMRADGAIMRLDPAAFSPPEPESEDPPPNGILTAELPNSGTTQFLPPPSELYVDLEFIAVPGADPGDVTVDWYALRQDGRLYSSFSAPPGPTGDWVPLVNMPGDGGVTSAPYIDLALQDRGDDGVSWFGLRYNGKVHFGQLGTEVLDLPGGNYWRIAVSADPIDGTAFKNAKPQAAVYKTKLVTDQAITIPLIVNDTDRATEELVLIFDEEKDFKKMPPGSVFDAEARTVTFPGTPDKGGYRFSFRVDDGSGQAPKKFNYPIRVMPLDDKPDRNKPPVVTPISKLRAFVEEELTFPLFAVDRDPEDTLTIEIIETKQDDIFDLGATFDPETATVTWTPTLEHLGKQRASFWVRDDGDPQRKRRLNIRVDVLAPLIFSNDDG